MFGFDIADIIVNIPITLLSLTVHELAHGWVSSKLGDPTPRYQGRLTLNPLAHLDITGTILMILTGFGWAKPVQVNPTYYKNTKRGMALVAFAGPMANFLLAVVTSIFIILLYIAELFFGLQLLNNTVMMFLGTLMMRNIGLMVFNLIPIPPLDGSKILGMFLPNSAYYKLLQYERYSLILIMVLSLTGALDSILGFGINMVYNLISLPINLISYIL